MVARGEQSIDQQIEQLRAELEGLKAQLVQAQKLSSVGALAASITHEFNNILMTIINYAKMGLRHKDHATREKALDKILNAGQRASKITTGMLAYARGKDDRREACNLVHLVEEVLVLVEKDLQMHRVRLQTDFSGNPHALINPNQIQQVLVNLVVNARQAMNGGGRLTISVRTNAETGMAEIAVRDSGSGIPADKLPKIFDPFFSTKKVDSQGQGGTGLGLALCREIIEAHQGRIRVESALDKGTTFTLKFPAVPMSVPAAQSTAPAASLAIPRAS